MTRYEFGNNKPVQAFGLFEDHDLCELLEEMAKECRGKKRNKRLLARVATIMERAGYEITEFRRVGSWTRGNPPRVGDRVFVVGKTSRGVVFKILGRAAWVEFDDGQPGTMHDLTELTT